jgi:hypothetical protein
MNTVPGQVLYESLRAVLEERGFWLEGDSTEFWGEQRSVRRRWLFGHYTVVYCMTCTLDEEYRVVHLQDAVLQHWRGLLPARRDATKAAGCRRIRAALERLTQSAGWHLRYGQGSRPADAPGVLRV